ncbi:MAG: hypothetical protein Q9217_000403 [Psora testacea]
MSQKRDLSPSPMTSQTYKSSPIYDRSSKFIAVYSPNQSAKELQTLPEFKSATHRIAAWRRPSIQRSLIMQRLLDADHDDDGEARGGKALEQVLDELKAEGAVVVARWYGGVMLGPVRFDHMKSCAMEAISKWKTETEASHKRAKLEVNEREERNRLITELPERDQSIIVLRELLAKKKQKANGEGAGGLSPAKTLDYAILPLTTLRQMDRVRDATISWILKQIDTAEDTEQKCSDSVEKTAAAI